MSKILRKCEAIYRKALCHVSPVAASKFCYYRCFRKKINLKNPQTFNEKLMWLKLNNYMKNPTVWKCVDKYKVREYAKNKGVSEKNLPELINVYNSVDDIEFNVLPQKFALKCSHGCGFNIICEDKDKLDISLAKQKLKKWMKTKFGYDYAELQYIHESPVILCEKYIEGNGGFPFDYKVYCFEGVPKAILVCSERESKVRLNYFDLEWNDLLIGKEEYRSNNKIPKPEHFDDMIEIAKKVSAEFPFVRVDFYESSEKAILGEMTFTPAGCMAKYYNENGEKYLSKLLKIENYVEKKV